MGTFKKTYRKARRAVKQRYFPGKGYSKPSIAKMIDDIKKLQMIVNSEKKNFDVSNGSISTARVGQVNQDATGHYDADITPYIPQGITDSSRIGDSIKVKSSVLFLKFKQMASTISRINLIADVYYTARPQSDITNDVTQLIYRDDPSVSGAQIISTNSQINQDYRGLFKLIARRKFHVGGDTVSGQNQSYTKQLNISWNKGFGQHFKYDENTNSTSLGQIILIIRADRGNRAGSPNTSTLSGATDTAFDTGLFINWNVTHYYYDN